MAMAMAMMVALMGLSHSGCTGTTVFQCANAEQCAVDGQRGTCEPDGYCSFPDDSCPSGRRYGGLSPDGLAGSCVPVGGSSTGVAPTMDGGSAGQTTTTTTTSGVMSSTTAVDGTTLAVEDTGPPPPMESSTSAESSTGEPPGIVLNFPATLAACNEPMMPDPVACAQLANPDTGAVTVDLDDMGVGPYNTYLQFELDDQLVPAAVTSITVELTVTDARNAEGIASGEVYEVEPFTLDDLSMGQPMTLGELLAPDQGAVMLGQTVQWSLPPDLLDDGRTTLYLSVQPTTDNGVDYWSHEGMVPPELVVEQMR